MPLEGLIVPIPTAFTSAGGIDPAGTEAFVRGLASAGVDHIFLLGSVGEFPCVEDEERPTLIAAAVRGLRSPTDLWVGVGAPATGRAVRLARGADDGGASAVVAVPPYYLPPTAPSIVAYYRALRAATKLPLFAYNIPSKVGYALSVELVQTLAREGTIQGVKDTSGSIDSVRSFLQGAPAGFRVYPGDDHLATAGVRDGAAGAVMGLANIVPRLGVALLAALRAPRPEEADGCQALLDRLGQVASLGPFPSNLKFLARELRGAPVGYRPPYLPLTPAEERRVKEGLSAIEPALRVFLGP